MKRLTAIATVAVVALLIALTINVKAQDFNTNEKTFVTFSAPVELPGMNLPAGKYVFRLGDTMNRNLVQILSEDEKQLHGQFIFVNAQRMEPAEDTIITFKETAEGTTPAVQFWFYPGETIGKEFVYPKDQAMRIAARTRAGVLTADGRIHGDGVPAPAQAEAAQAEPARAEPVQAEAAQVEAAQPAPAPASEAPAPAQPTAAAGSLAGNRGVQAERIDRDSGVSSDAPVGTSGRAAAQNEGQVAANELPRTASPLPISGLIGLLSLAGGVGLRFARR